MITTQGWQFILTSLNDLFDGSGAAEMMALRYGTSGPRITEVLVSKSRNSWLWSCGTMAQLGAEYSLTQHPIEFSGTDIFWGGPDNLCPK